MTMPALQLARTPWGRLTKILFAVPALVLLISSVSPAAEPAIVVSIKSFDELLADIQYLGDVVNQPQLAALPQVWIGQITGGQGLKGLDGSKPIGAYVTLSPEGLPEDLVVFVPVSDQKEFAATLAKLSPDTQQVGDLTQYHFLGNPNPVLGKAGAKHFFFAPTAESLKETADPARLVTTPADISIEVDLTKIPDAFKELFFAQVEASEGSGAQAKAPQSEAERLGQEAGSKALVAGFRRLSLDASRISLSLDVNAKTKSTVLDLSFAAIPGTALAQACAGFAKTESPFAGLISKQTIGSYFVSAPLSSDVEGMFKLIFDEGEKGGLSDLPAEPAAKEAAARMIRRMSELGRSTFQRGRFDQAVIVNSADGRVQIVVAMALAKGDQVGQLLEEFVKNTPEAEEFIKLNVVQIGKVKVHSVTVPEPFDEDARKHFGSPAAHFAISDDSAVFILGGDSLAAVKSALERPAASAPRAPISVKVAMSKILALINDLDSSQIPPAVLEQSKSALAGGLDAVALEITGQPQALKNRLEVQEGVLRLGAVAATGN